MEVQEALWYFLKGRNGYIKLKFGKYNYSLHIHACRAVKPRISLIYLCYKAENLHYFELIENLTCSHGLGGTLEHTRYNNKENQSGHKCDTQRCLD